MSYQKIDVKDEKIIKNLFKKINLPKKKSHKGQNGRVLVIGGSSLFHAASLWAAETCSHFADLVHYSSTKENNQIALTLKKKFLNGIVIPQSKILEYVKEDDVILIGVGMVRDKKPNFKKNITFKEILKIKNEGHFAYFLTYYLLSNFPQKKFVIDAGALQMMEKEWFQLLKNEVIITPHQTEFTTLFNIEIRDKNQEEKMKIISQTAKKYHTTIILKAIDDFVSDGEKNAVIIGGNQGLTKGGTGDVLAALASSFLIKNPSFFASIYTSVLLKKTAEDLFKSSGYWYNVNEIINQIPKTLKELVFS